MPDLPKSKDIQTGANNSGLGVFGRRISLGTILGFDIGIDASWIFIAGLVTWSLAKGWFPARHEGLGNATYWAMGAAGAIGLFVSVVLHELSHSLVGRRYGIEMRGITLFLFGGVAQMGNEPSTPKAELVMAAAGPIASVVIGGGFFLLSYASEAAAAPTSVTGVLAYLGLINLVLAGFNILPAFPLDGGRVLRAILWKTKGNVRWATRVTAQVGVVFGMAFMVLGLMALLGGNVVGGMWWFLIGLFLRSAARMSYQQLLVRRALQGEPVRRFMRTEPRTVPLHTPVRTLIEDFFYQDYHKMYPVVDDGQLLGCVTINRVKGVSQDQWDTRTVRDLMTACSDHNTIQADTDAVDALSLMRRSGISRIMVVDGTQLVGVLTLKDILQFLAVRIELEED